MNAPRMLLIILIATFAAPVCAEDQYPFSVESIKNGNEHIIVARNQGPAPISLKAELTEQNNLSSDREWPIYVVVRPYSDLPIAKLFSNYKGNGYRFSYRTSYNQGDFSAMQDPRAMYSLPYEDGKTFRISQASNGPITTHTEPHNRYAIDFAMPEGTSILAARDGVVISAIGNNYYGGTERGLWDKANHVRVLHEDGTIATYAHLTPNGIAVQVGQHIYDGDLIGYSGSTGYSSGPHLHFAVTQTIRANSGFNEISVPINLYVGSPAIAFQPLTGMILTAEYSRPVETPGIAPNPNVAMIPRRNHEISSKLAENSSRDRQAEISPSVHLAKQTGWQNTGRFSPTVWFLLACFIFVGFVVFKVLDGMSRKKRQREIDKIRKMGDR